ncbi:hypothetical protein [Salinarimonas chemoclinalis]|uniref:hypothetical protein n=1 Tax=Salinarimonas chemoclinalis TaxID=3241599 RepID=UPI00355930A5
MQFGSRLAACVAACLGLGVASAAQAQWEIAVASGEPGAVGAGVGRMSWLAVFCHRVDGLRVTTDLGAATPPAVAVDFEFRNVRMTVPFRRLSDETPYHFADERAIETLVGMLGGRDASVRISVDGGDLGAVSLAGSSRAITEMARGCPVGAPPPLVTRLRLEAIADEIDPNAPADRRALARDWTERYGMPAPAEPVSVEAEDLPAEVREQIGFSRETCGPGTRFREGALLSVDLNGDGRPDYLFSAHHVDCAAGWFLCGAANCPVDVFASLPDGRWETGSVLLGDWYAFDATGLHAPCADGRGTFSIVWEDGGLRTRYCG